MKSINPATGKVIRVYKETSPKDVQKTLQETHDAYLMWRQLSFDERAKPMRKVAELLRANKDRFATLMAEEMGKPFAQGQGEIEKCAWVCEFYADEAKNYLAPAMIQTEAKKSFVTYEPLGPILAIMPWNFPFWQVLRCAAPTIMAGNTMVLKHAANVFGCALAIEDLFIQAGFPLGTLRNVLVPNDKIQPIIEHPIIHAVTLTGSTRAGRAVGSQAGGVLKKTVLELGGSDPYIVLEDADIEAAAETCAFSRMINGGQSCVSAKRFIVVSAVLKPFQERFIEIMRMQKMGAPLEEGVTLGPMARHDLRDQLHQQVRRSVIRGANIALGGRVPKNPGAFYPATVLVDVKKGMPAYSEEFFGPVASIIKVHNEKEAIAVANDTNFGLGAAIFSRDIERAERIATTEIQAGCCFVNSFVKSDPRLPFGGIKHSGYGRELSSFGIQEFVNVKSVYIA